MALELCTILNWLVAVVMDCLGSVLVKGFTCAESVLLYLSSMIVIQKYI